MPLVLHQSTGKNVLCIWHLTESIENLIQNAFPDEYDLCMLAEIRNETRKKEWLSVRILINQILGFWPQIRNTEHGKPFLLNTNLQLSISHTKQMVGVLLGKSGSLGIDIERSNRNIDSVLSRFLSPRELQNIMVTQCDQHKILHWCAKETIFKAVNDTEIEFNKQIEITSISHSEPFGEVTAIYYSSNNVAITFEMQFTEINDHTIVWTL
jgi:4'-phosphopantetheinyl transferase